MLAVPFSASLRFKSSDGAASLAAGARAMEASRRLKRPYAAARAADDGASPSFRPLHRDRPSASQRRRKPKRRRIAGGGGGGDGIRPWVSSPRDVSAYKDRFVIVSYNILGVENVSRHLDLYHQIAQRHLSWDLRKKRIHKELSRYNPCIICFQEVDRFEDLYILLQKDGYTGVYKHRTGEASDGCAIFWKKELFTLLHEESIEFQKFGLRDNVAQLCLLKVRGCQSNVSENTESFPCQTLLIGNIHVLFNPNRGDIKLGQIRMLLERADIISREWGNPAIVLAGDFNSMPQSAIYQFLSSSELDILTYDRKKVSGQIEYPSRSMHFTKSDASRSDTSTFRMKYKWTAEELFLAAGNRGCTNLQNPLKLSSAYIGIPGDDETRDNNGEPLATSCHSRFTGTVDYIWHSSALVPTRLVETLPIKTLRRLGGLPSKDWGSDHLALVCEFAFVDDAPGTKDCSNKLEGTSTDINT